MALEITSDGLSFFAITYDGAEWYLRRSDDGGDWWLFRVQGDQGRCVAQFHVNWPDALHRALKSLRETQPA